jgi:asparagine synthase (glutamine-hydrolysing)
LPAPAERQTALRPLPRLEPLEIACGMVFGTWREHAPADPAPHPGSVRDVLTDLLLPALRRPPCAVAFSGGRDSSALLAVAAHVARVHGLPLPIPVILRYPDLPRTDETKWQDFVLEHLDLPNAEIVELHDELDLLGKIATTALRRHGLYWPPNAHTIVPLARAAAGGSLITGNGGDEVLAPWLWQRPVFLRGRRSWPDRREVVQVALYTMPTPLRKLYFRLRPPIVVPWLRDPARRELNRRFVEEWGPRSPTWLVDLEALLVSRSRELTLAALTVLAADAGADLVEPFYDPRFIRAVAAEAPPDGFSGRSEAFHTHFGDLLPPQITHRGTKASFTEAFWGPRAQAFARSWRGGGLDDRLVESEALRREWSQPRPEFRSLCAVQAGWLAQDASQA